jgi:hypothetical protein
MKSAYELALERLEREGIERPREEAYAPEALAEIAEIRRRCQAKIAELEILHRDRLAKAHDPVARQEEEESYLRERRRLEEERDRQLEKVRRT